MHLPGETEAQPAPIFFRTGALYFPDAARLNPAFGNPNRGGRNSTPPTTASRRTAAQVAERSACRSSTPGASRWTKPAAPSQRVSEQQQSADDVQLPPESWAVGLRLSIPSAPTSPGRCRGGVALAIRCFGGWELQGLVQVQTGPPFNPFVGFDRARFSAGRTTATATDLHWPAGRQGHPRRSASMVRPQLLRPSRGRDVRQSRTKRLRRPGTAVDDLAAHKVVWRAEGQSVQLRLEAFNVVNHPNFQLPSVLTLFTPAHLPALARPGRSRKPAPRRARSSSL